MVNALHLEAVDGAPWIQTPVRNTMREIHRVAMQTQDPAGSLRSLERLREQLDDQMRDGLQQYNELRARGEMMHREQLWAADHEARLESLENPVSPPPPERPPIASE